MWKRIKEHPRITISILLLVALAVTILIGGYRLNWAWTGFTGEKETYKTLYDWLQLLIIPTVLAIAGYVINLTISRSEQEATKQHAKTEREIAEDNQRETALKEYIDKISELLLKEHLGELTEDCKLKPEYEQVRKIARVQTLTVLPRLDGKRKGSVLKFLYESRLIDINLPIIDLSGADFVDAKLLISSQETKPNSRIAESNF